MMTVNDIQNLIELLNEAPEVAELSVTAPDGSEIRLKRSPFAAKPPADHSADTSGGDLLEAAYDSVSTLSIDAEPVLSAIAATMVGVFHSAKPPLEGGAVVKAASVP